MKNKVIITELPIGVWNEDYITYLEKCLETKKNKLKDYKDLSTDKDIHIELSFQSEVDFDKYSAINSLIKNFKLTSSISISNMYLFNKDEKLVHYKSVNDIINDFVVTRLEIYETRKQFLIQKMEQELKILSNKFKYIMEVLEGSIDLRKKKSQQINMMLEDKAYDKMENSYNYLIKMPMDSVNEENVEHLKEQYEKTKVNLEELKNKTIQDMYYDELDELEKSSLAQQSCRRPRIQDYLEVQVM